LRADSAASGDQSASGTATGSQASANSGKASVAGRSDGWGTRLDGEDEKSKLAYRDDDKARSKSTSADEKKSDTASDVSGDTGSDASGDAESGAAGASSDGSATREIKNTVALASGYVPAGWQVPEQVPDKKERDKLTDIKGVGPKLEGVLHSNGIYYFRQVANLDSAGVDELQEQMPEFRGRIVRDKWVEQAAELHRAKYDSEP